MHNKGPSEWSQSPRAGKGQQAFWMASGWGSSRIQEGGVQVWMTGEDKGQVSAVRKSEERISWWASGRTWGRKASQLNWRSFLERVMMVT